MIKTIILVMIITISVLFTGCNKINSNNNVSEIVNVDKEEKKYLVYYALDREYKETKDISIIEVGEEIYNERKDKPYLIGEYKEVDFAKDLLQGYLSGDESIYNYSISQENNDRLKESLLFLKKQMDIETNSPIYFKLDSVKYNGKIKNEKNTAILHIQGRISSNNNYFISKIDFIVNVKASDDKLMGDIE